MVQKTSARTPGFGCYFMMLVTILAGLAGYNQFRKNQLFPEGGIPYPPPWSVGCQGWDWWHPYLSDFVYLPAADPSRLQLAIYAYDNLAFYDLGERQFTRCLVGAAEGRLKISPDGKLLAIANPAGGIEIRQVTSDQVLANLSTGGIQVSEFEFSPNGQLLAFLAGDSLQLWDVAHSSQAPRELLAGVAYRPFAFSTDGETLGLVGYEKIWQWQTRDWSEKSALDLPEMLKARSTLGLTYFPSQNRLLLWNDQGFSVLDLADGREIYHWMEYTGPQDYLADLVLAPDGRYLALIGHAYWNGSINRTGSRLPGGVSFLNLWRTADWQHLGQLTGQGGALTFSPDSQTLAVDWEGKIRFMPVNELIPKLESSQGTEMP